MISRTSHVKRVIFKNIVFSSNCLIGDARYIDSVSDVLAVEFNVDCINTHELSIHEQKTNFEYRAPCPAINESINPSFYNSNLKICVNNVNIIAISAASIFQVGNSEHVRMSSSTYFFD